MFQLLQCLHSLCKLVDEEDIGTKVFRRKVEGLNLFIRSAIPNPQVMSKIKSISMAWVGNLNKALWLHYQTQIDFVSPIHLNHFLQH